MDGRGSKNARRAVCSGSRRQAAAPYALEWGRGTARWHLPPFPPLPAPARVRPRPRSPPPAFAPARVRPRPPISPAAAGAPARLCRRALCGRLLHARPASGGGSRLPPRPVGAWCQGPQARRAAGVEASQKRIFKHGAGCRRRGARIQFQCSQPRPAQGGPPPLRARAGRQGARPDAHRDGAALQARFLIAAPRRPACRPVRPTLR